MNLTSLNAAFSFSFSSNSAPTNYAGNCSQPPVADQVCPGDEGAAESGVSEEYSLALAASFQMSQSAAAQVQEGGGGAQASDCGPGPGSQCGDSSGAEDGGQTGGCGCGGDASGNGGSE